MLYYSINVLRYKYIYNIYTYNKCIYTYILYIYTIEYIIGACVNLINVVRVCVNVLGVNQFGGRCEGEPGTDIGQQCLKRLDVKHRVM